MKVDYDNGWFVARCAFEERHGFLDAGFTWVPSIKKLATESISVALKFRDLLTPEARAFIGLSTGNTLSPTVREKGWDYKDFQTEGIDYSVEREVTLIADEPGLGKGHPLGTHVATPEGWRAIGDLVPGDFVLGSSGRATRVLSIHPRGMQPIFRVMLDDGAHVTVDGDHLWFIGDDDGEWRTIDTRGLLGLVRHGVHPEIPVLSAPAEFLARDLPSSTVSALNRLNPKTYAEDVDHVDSREWVTASVGQRLEFLSALIRRAGKIRNGAVRLDIPAPIYREDLVEAVVQITRSIGGIAYVESRFRKAICTLHLPDDLWMSLFGYHPERKRINKKWHNFVPGVPARRVIDVTPVGVDKCVCISVDAKDSLYITEDFIVTHNTIQAIGVANRMRGIGSVLIVCLASHKEHWKRSFETWDVQDLSVEIATGKTEFPDSQVVVINYDIIHRFHDEIRAGTWDLIIMDEAHALKNKDARRTVYILGGMEAIPKGERKKGGPKQRKISPIKARRKVFLTGTPMTGRPRDLYTFIRAADPTLYPQYHDFALKFCGGYYDSYGNLDDTGSSNEDELNALLRSLLMIRHLKDEVMKELPPKTRTVLPLASEGLSRKIAAERDAIAELLAAYEKKIGTVADLTTEEIADLVLNATPRLFEDYAREAEGELDKNTPINKLAIARQELALAKVPMIIEHLKAVLESETCVVFFGYHQAVIEAVRDAFPGCAVVYGKTPMKKRQPEVDRFQDGLDPECRVFVGQYTAAGTGFTMTRSRVVVCGELTWVPHELSQAEDRCIYAGQPVLTRRGSVNIEDVRIGDQVMTHLGRWRTVTSTSSKQNRGGVTEVSVVGYNSPIKTTDDHKYYVYRDGSMQWVEAHDIKLTDYLVMPVMSSSDDDYDYYHIPSEFMVPTEFTNSWGAQQRNGRAVHVDKIKLTLEWCELLGRYAAEGYCATGEAKGRFVSLSGNVLEKSIFEGYIRLFKDIGVKASIRQTGNGIEMRAYSANVARMFRHLFVGDDCYTKIVPDIVWEFSSRQKLAFLRGYHNGDGYSNSRSSLEYVTASRSLAYGMAVIAAEVGYSPCVRTITNVHNSRQMVVTGNLVSDRHVGDYVLYKVSGVATSREIRSEDGKHPRVYDLTVEEDHSFMVGPVVVHNCHRFGQEDNVLVYHLVVTGSLDDVLINRIMVKQETNDRILDGKGKSHPLSHIHIKG